MRIRLYINKSVQENAALYYEQAKEARKKREGLVAAIEQTKKEMAAAEKKQKEDKKVVKIKREKRWFEKFHWFTTSEGKLAIGGRSAQQNDLVVSKHMEDNDLFFHADIQGGMVVVLKDGAGASEQELLETAQFAASFSNAWKNGNASVDVYAVRKDQIGKAVSGGYIPSGAFAISGERRWFRNTRLGLKAGLGESGNSEIAPAISKKELLHQTLLAPSRTGKEKGALAKSLTKKFSVHPDELLEILPSGKTKIL